MCAAAAVRGTWKNEGCGTRVADGLEAGGWERMLLSRGMARMGCPREPWLVVTVREPNHWQTGNASESRVSDVLQSDPSGSESKNYFQGWGGLENMNEKKKEGRRVICE